MRRSCDLDDGAESRAASGGSAGGWLTVAGPAAATATAGAGEGARRVRQRQCDLDDSHTRRCSSARAGPPPNARGPEVLPPMATLRSGWAPRRSSWTDAWANHVADPAIDADGRLSVVVDEDYALPRLWRRQWYQTGLTSVSIPAGARVYVQGVARYPRPASEPHRREVPAPVCR